MAQSDVREIRGVIVIPEGDVPIRLGRVVARIEDVSRADARSVCVAEQVQDDVAVTGDGEIRFSIAHGRLDPSRRYTIRAHLDVGGTGGVTEGDYVTTSSYPVTGDEQEMRLATKKV
jgi:hypothetical protein